MEHSYLRGETVLEDGSEEEYNCSPDYSGVVAECVGHLSTSRYSSSSGNLGDTHGEQQGYLEHSSDTEHKERESRLSKTKWAFQCEKASCGVLCDATCTISPSVHGEMHELKGKGPHSGEEHSPTTFDFDELVLGSVIGYGQFGSVRIARWRNCDVVVKTLKTMMARKELQEFKNEAELLHNLQAHRNVVQFYGFGTAVEDGREITFIVTEYLKNGDLRELLRSKTLLPQQKLKMAHGAAAGMYNLHCCGILHRDLAARNLLVTNDMEDVKVADFGMSRRGEEYTNEAAIAPVKWMSPQSLRGKWSQACDVYSFGVVLWEIFSNGRDPYDQMSIYQVAGFVLSGGRLEIPPSTPGPIARLMTSCWQEDPLDRPTFGEICVVIRSAQNSLITKCPTEYVGISPLRKLSFHPRREPKPLESDSYKTIYSPLENEIRFDSLSFASEEEVVSFLDSFRGTKVKKANFSLKREVERGARKERLRLVGNKVIVHLPETLEWLSLELCLGVTDFSALPRTIKHLDLSYLTFLDSNGLLSLSHLVNLETLILKGSAGLKSCKELGPSIAKSLQELVILNIPKIGGDKFFREFTALSRLEIGIISAKSVKKPFKLRHFPPALTQLCLWNATCNMSALPGSLAVIEVNSPTSKGGKSKLAGEVMNDSVLRKLSGSSLIGLALRGHFPLSEKAFSNFGAPANLQKLELHCAGLNVRQTLRVFRDSDLCELRLTKCRGISLSFVPKKLQVLHLDYCSVEKLGQEVFWPCFLKEFSMTHCRGDHVSPKFFAKLPKTLELFVSRGMTYHQQIQPKEQNSTLRIDSDVCIICGKRCGCPYLPIQCVCILAHPKQLSTHQTTSCGDWKV